MTIERARGTTIITNAAVEDSISAILRRRRRQRRVYGVTGGATVKTTWF